MQDETDTEALTTAAPQRGGQIARRDFAGSSFALTNPATEMLAAKARADTEARWIMAMRQPRHMDTVRTMLLEECRRPAFADKAIYKKPVGSVLNETTGKWEKAYAEGLSIRFAEVAARCMGNMSPDVTTIYDDDKQRIVRVTVTEYESNVTWSRDLTIAKTVERRKLKKGQRPISERENSFGDLVYLIAATDDEVNMKEAAAVSKAARTLILRVIPGGLQDECRAVIAKVAADKSAKDPAGERNRMIDAFAGIGVKPLQLERYLGHGLDTVSPTEVADLRGVYTAISDGEMSWAEALAEVESQRDVDASARPAAPQGSSAQPPVADRKAEPAKGTSALKNTLKRAAPSATSTPPQPPVDAPKTEKRPCEGCMAEIEVDIGAPPFQLCADCQDQSRKD